MFTAVICTSIMVNNIQEGWSEQFLPGAVYSSQTLVTNMCPL